MRSPYEIRAQKELEAEGWLVDNKAGMGRFSKNRDYWHIFDLLAVKQGHPLRWISIKGTQGLLEPLKAEIRAFWMPPGNQKELWCRARIKSRFFRWNKWIAER